MSLSIEQRIKALKSSIVQITSHQTGGVQAKQDLAFSVFVKFSLGVMLNQLIARYRHYGITDAELAEHIYIDDTHFSLDEKIAGTLNAGALAKSVRLYKEILENLPAFSDLLMSLMEEITQHGKKGDGLGQFLTPTDISGLLALLLHSLPVSTKIKPKDLWTFYDMSCGAGSLQLPRVAIEAAQGRHRTSLISLEMNDIDPLMCCAAALQFVSNMVVHEHDLHQLRVTCSNTLTETKPNSKTMVVIKTPEKVLLNVKLAHDQHMQEKLQLFKHMNSLTNRILNKS